MILWPELGILRRIGRLAFPIFAYMVSEGCWYTRNKLRYFLNITLPGLVFQLIYYLTTGDGYLNILLTFCMSILLIYALRFLRHTLSGCENLGRKAFSCGLMILTLGGVWTFCRKFQVDYGFWGIMTPVLADVFRGTKRDCLGTRTAMLAMGLLLVAASSTANQYLSLLAIPLLLRYNGRRGKVNMKWFFYIFYPAHLVILYGIGFLL